MFGNIIRSIQTILIDASSLYARIGLDADLYELPEDTFGDGASNPDNACYDTSDYTAVKGLQNISPCQYGAPVYVSNPHFYLADPALLADVEGLRPNKTLHDTFFKIQPVCNAKRDEPLG